MSIANKIITPIELWKDFNPDDRAELLYKANKDVDLSAQLDEILFRAWTEKDGDLDIAARLYTPGDAKDVIVLMEDTDGIERIRELERMLGFGYAVLVADYSAMHNWGTDIPESLSYGIKDKRGDRMERFERSPSDSCQFLYARILSRTIGVAKELFPDGKIVVLSLGDAAEFCIQGVAMDKRADGLIIVNGNTYEEYNDLNRFDDVKTSLSTEMMVWLTAVAGVAYVKHLACPVLTLSGSNSLSCDPDRLEDFFSGLENESLTVLVRAGERNSLDNGCFSTLSKWLEGIRAERSFPAVPECSVKVYDDEGMVTADIQADPSSMIESVYINYAFKEKNRRFRYYERVPATLVSMAGEYMANFPLSDNVDCVFAFATVNYLDGLSTSSFMAYAKVAPSEESAVKHNVVLSGSDSYDEFEIDRNAFILALAEKDVVTTGLGLKGVISKKGGLRTFALNDNRVNKNASILQIDFYSEKKKTILIEIEKWEDNLLTKYNATVEIGGSSRVFIPVRLVVGDFKTKDHIALDSFEDIKSLSVLTPMVGVGNVLFV